MASSCSLFMWSLMYIGPLMFILTPWSWALLERSLAVWTLDSFPAFYETQRFNTEFTRALHLPLSWARPIQSTSPHPTSTRYILILSNHLHLGLPSGRLPSGFPTNNPSSTSAVWSATVTTWIQFSQPFLIIVDMGLCSYWLCGFLLLLLLLLLKVYTSVSNHLMPVFSQTKFVILCQLMSCHTPWWM
jgi:hypothetical protein